MPATLDGAANQTAVDVAAAYLIVIAASSGGLKAMSRIIKDLPRRLEGAIVLVQHRSALVSDVLEAVLATRTSLRVETAGHGQRILANRLYVAKPDQHLTITADGHFRYVDGSRIQHTLSAADPLLSSAAETYGSRLIAVVLTGRGSDAALGIRDVRGWGGLIIAQDPETADAPDMPKAAIATGAVHVIMPLAQIGLELRHQITIFDAAANHAAAAGG
jgi:two-component system chemotaxis response regulator CheB